MRKEVMLAIVAFFFCVQAQAQQEQFLMASGANFKISEDYRYRTEQPAPEELPPVSLRKTADFLVVRVRVENDSRDADQRRAEVDETLREMLRAADQGGRIQLHTGEYPITENSPVLALSADEERPDSAYAHFFVKVPLKGEDDVRALTQEMLTFVSKTKPVGRTQLRPGDVGLSMVDPEQYRYELLQKIAEDVAKVKEIFGGDFGLNIDGLDKRIKVRRVGATEVELYLMYGFTMRPKE